MGSRLEIFSKGGREKRRVYVSWCTLAAKERTPAASSNLTLDYISLASNT